MGKILSIICEKLHLVQTVSDIFAKVVIVVVGSAVLKDLLREKYKKEPEAHEPETSAPIGFKITSDSCVAKKQ